MLTKKPYMWVNQTEHEDYVTRVFEVEVPAQSNKKPIQPKEVGKRKEVTAIDEIQIICISFNSNLSHHLGLGRVFYRR